MWEQPPGIRARGAEAAGGARAGLTRIFTRWSGMQEEVTEIFFFEQRTDRQLGFNTHCVTP